MLSFKLLDEVCKGGCCWQGPSRYIVNSGGKAEGISGWPEKHDSVEECAKRCEELPDCQAFHYYGPEDPSPDFNGYKDCYLQKFGDIGPQLGDGRDRYAGVCPQQSGTVWSCFVISLLGHP